jgi:hypothetical protein
MEFHSGFDLALRNAVTARFQTLCQLFRAANTRTVSPPRSTFKNMDSPWPGLHAVITAGTGLVFCPNTPKEGRVGDAAEAAAMIIEEFLPEAAA